MRFIFQILAVLLGLGGFAHAQSSQVIYNETKALHDWYVPITTVDYTAWRYIHHLQLPALQTGDVLIVTATGQIANDNQFRAEIVTAVTLQPATPYYHEDLWGINGHPGFADFIVHPGGENIDGPTGRHYMRATHASSYKMPVDMPTAFVTFKVRVRAPEAATNAYYAYIRGPGYGKLTVTILRPIPAP